ncbi:MAG: HlyC/CorC family transporter [Alphaproteobacteria bacterium]|nr:HlyC/CorC family transporter [Alphaproteobacteria bacterium]
MAELILVLLLILLNGFFAMSELAIVSSSKPLLRKFSEENRFGAGMALKLAEAPERMLSTVQVGITVIGILAGMVSGAAFSGDVEKVLIEQFQLDVELARALAATAVVAVVTYFSVVIGELVPKQMALRHPESMACAGAPVMAVLAWLGAPVVKLLGLSSRCVLRLFGEGRRDRDDVIEEEVKALIAEGVQSGLFEAEEKRMLDSVMRLADKPVKAFMTPRTDVVWIDVNDGKKEVMVKLDATPYSRFPACEGSVDNVLGIVQARDLLDEILHGRELDIRAAVKPAPVLYDSASTIQALEILKKASIHLAVVLDEYGGLQGVLSATDILEAIVGVLPDEEGHNPDIVLRSDGSWLVDGGTPIDALREHFGIKISEDEEGDYHTAAGFVLARMGTIPKEGEGFDFGGYLFEVIDMDGRRVDKIHVMKKPEF